MSHQSQSDRLAPIVLDRLNHSKSSQKLDKKIFDVEGIHDGLSSSLQGLGLRPR
jgi:hypothetical protein